MVNIEATSEYLNKSTMGYLERMANDARVAGLSVAVEPTGGGIIVGNITVRSFRALQAVIETTRAVSTPACAKPELRFGEGRDELIRQRHGERIQARFAANCPWPKRSRGQHTWRDSEPW